SWCVQGLSMMSILPFHGIRHRSPKWTERIIGHGLNAELTIALAALGLSAEAAHLVLTGLFGLVHKDLHSLRLFVQSYRQIDQDKAQATVQRWKTEENSQKLRQKLREMAADFERGGTAPGPAKRRVS
ncbi:hypothetical protein ACTJJ7_03945, partial [Phyllobacterium sp. 22229]